jgi:DNA-binding response OmpR family regulator
MDRRGQRDRRRVPRGGRRAYDRPGRYPPVLVAESYEPARRPFVRYLERFNFDVAEAADGEQALARIVASPPRVVLIEWGLPMMSGSRLSQWLAQGWRTRDVRVIAIAGDNDVDAPAMPHVDGVLVKPFSLASMLDEIRRVLR